MRALVTGATGFIGNYLVKALRSKGWEVVCQVRRPVLWDDEGIICINGDLLVPDSLTWSSSQVGAIDVVFHLAALLPQHCTVGNEIQFFIANGLSTYKLLNLALKFEVNSFVYTSSLPVIGKPEKLPITETHPVAPLHPYLLSKLNGELACELVRRTTKMRVTSLRISSPYGPGMTPVSVLPLFVNQVTSSTDIQLYGSGQRTQNFVHVKDVVQACLAAARTSCPGVYNIGGRQSYSMQNLALTIIQSVPESRSRCFFAKRDDFEDDYRWEVSLNHSNEQLEYSPKIDFQDGINEYITYCKAGQNLQTWWKPL